ncbi:sulfotransferase domain-containing protein [uncultured Pseudokineococcus sp.]|uniref:sulfotransferase domain-containing protein n=1 Tax=uncultured Pseudokineococcus sp. TaxID=1642928 RepID=UPI002627847C|nr:sulfotransferase domain-containing protein [uncultured Pseudokineococcus sp.]
MDARRRYRSGDEDSARWDAVPLRAGDVVVSTRSKHGTTWVQAVLLHLLHGAGPLPDRLPVLAPWVDHLVEPVDALAARLAAQEHRRVLKTHTPLDGVPLVDGVTYVVVARHPLDAAVSLFHQGANLDRAALARLSGGPRPAAGPARERPPLEDWLARWVDDDPDPRVALDSLPGVAHHLRDAWARRTGSRDVVLVHYADLLADLPGEVRRLADRLDVDASEDEVRAVAAATTLGAMRERADEVAPDAGVLLDRRAFFRGGRSGDGRAAAPADVLARYDARVGALLPHDLRTWLHR